MPFYDVETIGQLAYVWGWPLVNMAKRADRAALMTDDGDKQILIQGTPVGYGQLVMQTDFVRPYERVICCPSHSLIYGSGVFHLAGSPGVVIQVPEFGKRYWLYNIYDARTNEFSEIGRQHNTKTGFYLLVGPGWKGPPPVGIDPDHVWKSSTDLALVIPRIYTDGSTDDLGEIQPLLQQIQSYPVSQFNPHVMVSKAWNVPNIDPIVLHGRGAEARFVKREIFIKDLRDVMSSVPYLRGEKALYDSINDVLDQARWDPVIRLRLKRAFRKADNDIIAELMQWNQNGESAGNGWFTSVNAADWQTPEDKAVALARAATAKSNMLENRADETKYYYTDTDSSGNLLYGSNRYSITFPKDQLLKDHVNEAFWSITVYDEYHCFNTVTNPPGRYSLGGTRDKDSLVYDEDGSLTICAGPAPLQQGDRNWLPTPQEEPFSLYIRAYWPDAFILQGHWQPPVVEIA